VAAPERGGIGAAALGGSAWYVTRKGIQLDFTKPWSAKQKKKKKKKREKCFLFKT